jgi:hypothetical protein
MLSTALELAGFALIVTAAALVAIPLGIAAAGVSCILLGYLLGREL